MAKSRAWTDEETERLRALARQGMTATKIAEALNRDDATVRKKADEFGIEIQRLRPLVSRDDVPTHHERLAIFALKEARPFPMGVGRGTLAGLLRKGWIVKQMIGRRTQYAATPVGLEAAKRTTALRGAQELADGSALQERRLVPANPRATQEKRLRYEASARNDASADEPKRPLVASPPWTIDEDRRVGELAYAGKGPTEIASVLGRTVSAVQNRLYKLRNRKDNG